MPRSFLHNPGDTAPFYVDFGSKGNQVDYCGEVDSVVWTLEGDAATAFTKESQSNDGLVCEVVLKGGVAGNTYSVACTASMGSGKCELTRRIEIVCEAQ